MRTGEGMFLSSIDEARRAFESGAVEMQAKVKVRVPLSETNERGEMVRVKRTVDTTIGRALLSEILPEGLVIRSREPADDQEGDFQRASTPVTASWVSRRPSFLPTS